MTSVPIIPDSAPFTPDQRAWLNGFLAGLISRGEVGAVVPAANAVEKPRLLIAFGSQSGNAEALAKKLNKEAAAKGFAARSAGLDTLQAAQLTQEQIVLIITSTWGEGDMPDNAVSFWEGLNQNGTSPNLGGVSYSVLALGDLNYGDTFCLAGRRLDERLEELGARRIHPRVDCDVDFDDLAKAWSEGVFQSLKNAPSTGGAAAAVVTAPVEVVEEKETGYSKKNPLLAPLIANVKLNADGSAKDTRHIGFSLAGSGLVYETGDALGVYVENCQEVVSSVIADHQLDANAMVPVPSGGEAPLHEALRKHYEVRVHLGKTLEAPVTAVEFVDSLRKLQPRLYSIASSLKAHPEEVHLCIGAVRYEKDGLAHKGVASTFLADRCESGAAVGVFVHTASHFRVPAVGTVPIIMVGPGTGIAPFRAFIEEREATGATGKNWLFFGDQYSATDYLYREQIEKWHDDGILTRLDLAFSRDQPEKIYVQTRMLEHAAEMWRWLEEGAHFYVCGDASRMAKDVDAALHTIVEREGGRSADDAAAYIAQMKKSKRYARDVY